MNIKIKTLMTFLKYKGWKIKETTEYDFLIIPPSDLKEIFEEPNVIFRVPLPKYEQAEDFGFVMKKLMRSFSILHNIEQSELEVLCSKTVEEIKANIELEKEMLALV